MIERLVWFCSIAWRSGGSLEFVEASLDAVALLVQFADRSCAGACGCVLEGSQLLRRVLPRPERRHRSPVGRMASACCPWSSSAAEAYSPSGRLPAAGRPDPQADGFWCSSRERPRALRSPLSRLLVSPDDSGIEHQVLILPVLDQVVKDALPHGTRPAHEPHVHALVLAVALRKIPERNTQSTPLTNWRLSTAVRPTCSTRPGSTSLIRSHCASLNSYRLGAIKLVQQI